MKRSRIFAAVAAAVVLVVGLVCQQGDVSAASLSTTVQLVFKAELSQTAGLTNATAPLVLQRILTWANGAGASQASTVWTAEHTLAASASENLDLAGGGLTDAFGAAFAPTKVRLLVVSAAAGNTNDVVVGGDANSLPFLSVKTTTVAIPPGGVVVLAVPSLAGIAVTAGTGDIVKVANGGAGTTVTYDIVIIGS
jgi:hypothetical protein